MLWRKVQRCGRTAYHCVARQRNVGRIRSRTSRRREVLCLGGNYIVEWLPCAVEPSNLVAGWRGMTVGGLGLHRVVWWWAHGRWDIESCRNLWFVTLLCAWDSVSRLCGSRAGAWACVLHHRKCLKMKYFWMRTNDLLAYKWKCVFFIIIGSIDPKYRYFVVDSKLHKLIIW